MVTQARCRQQQPVPRSLLSFREATLYTGEKKMSKKQAKPTASLLSQEGGSRMVTACDAAGRTSQGTCDFPRDRKRVERVREDIPHLSPPTLCSPIRISCWPNPTRSQKEELREGPGRGRLGAQAGWRRGTAGGVVEWHGNAQQGQPPALSLGPLPGAFLLSPFLSGVKLFPLTSQAEPFSQFVILVALAPANCLPRRLAHPGIFLSKGCRGIVL